jgi:D-amino peptidase
MLRSLVRFIACAAGVAAGGSAGAAAQAPGEPPAGWAWNAIAPASSSIRVLLIYDMEGLVGVDRYEMTSCSYPDDYRAGQSHLAADVNAVVAGLVDAGARYIGVLDRHGSGCDDVPDLPTALLDPRATMLWPAAGEVLDEEWDAVVLVGMHTAPGSDGFLEHTGSFGYARVVNGVSIMEPEQFALGVSRRGVPVIFASGDDRLERDFAARMPWVVFSVTKRALDRTTVVLRTVAEARADLRRDAATALRQRGEARTLSLVPPFEGAYRAVWPQSLAPLAALPGIDLTSGEIRVTASSPGELNAALINIQNLVASFWWAEMFWHEARSSPELVERAERLFMERWKAGPPGGM